MSQKFVLQFQLSFQHKTKKVAQDSQCYDSNFLQWLYNGGCSFSTFAVALEGGKRIAAKEEKTLARSKRKVQQSQLYYEQCTLYTIYIYSQVFLFPCYPAKYIYFLWLAGWSLSEEFKVRFCKSSEFRQKSKYITELQGPIKYMYLAGEQYSSNHIFCRVNIILSWLQLIIQFNGYIPRNSHLLPPS